MQCYPTTSVPRDGGEHLHLLPAPKLKLMQAPQQICCWWAAPPALAHPLQAPLHLLPAAKLMILFTSCPPPASQFCTSFSAEYCLLLDQQGCRDLLQAAS